MDAIGMLLLTLPVVYPAVMALNGGEDVSVQIVRSECQVKCVQFGLGYWLLKWRSFV